VPLSGDARTHVPNDFVFHIYALTQFYDHQQRLFQFIKKCPKKQQQKQIKRKRILHQATEERIKHQSCLYKQIKHGYYE
jgi:hypothetical protein